MVQWSNLHNCHDMKICFAFCLNTLLYYNISITWNGELLCSNSGWEIPAIKGDETSECDRAWFSQPQTPTYKLWLCKLYDPTQFPVHSSGHEITKSALYFHETIAPRVIYVTPLMKWMKQTRNQYPVRPIKSCRKVKFLLPKCFCNIFV